MQPNPYANEGQGQFVDEEEYDEEPEVEEVIPPNESGYQSEIRNGVVTAKPQPEQQAEEAPASQEPKPPAMEGSKEPSGQEEPQQEEIPPEVKKQLTGLIQGLEGAMTNGTPVEELAVQILTMAPPEQLKPFADTPINQLAMDISNIVPGTLLASYNGRKYLSQLQAVLKEKITS